MFRILISWFVLILIPAVSLGFAIIPYAWVKKRKRPVLWKHLWIAFFVGLAGNVGLWWVVNSIVNDKISIFLFGMSDDGIMLSWLLYVLFISFIPFIFYKLKYGHLKIRQMIYAIILGIILLFLEIGAIIYLFFANLYRLMI